MLPLERIAQLFEDLTGFRPSEATLLSQLRRMNHALEESEQQIKTALFNETVVHQTRFRVGEKTKWLHTVSNGNWTLLNVHDKRGSQAWMSLASSPSIWELSFFRDHYDDILAEDSTSGRRTMPAFLAMHEVEKRKSKPKIWGHAWCRTKMPSSGFFGMIPFRLVITKMNETFGW